MTEIIHKRRSFIKKIALSCTYFLSVSSLGLFSQKVWARIGQFYGFRTWESPDNTRVVADFSTEIKYTSFILQNPLRVVFDIENAIPIKSINPNLKNDPRIKEIRSGMYNEKFRIVFELKKNSHIKSFQLEPQGRYTYRLVVDIYDYEANPNVAAASPSANSRPTTTQRPPENQVVAQNITQNLNTKQVYTVLIDPGHGGEDPGAVGRKHNTYEKDVVLDISKRVANQINRHPRMRAHLTRTNDYYISLRERINRARKHNADIFLSIHADSAQNRRAKGSSVYVLSTKGASGEFERLLAKRENAADFVGGVENANSELNDLLLSVVQNDTIDKSSLLAESIIKELSSLRKPHSNEVKKAGFVVLKSPHIPSVLVETAFLSNSTDEEFLRIQANRNKIASSIYQGVKNYLHV